MGVSAFRSAHGNQKRPEGLCSFPEEYSERRFPDVPVQHVYQALHEPRKRRCACKAGKIHPSFKRAYRGHVHYRQAIWDDGNIQGKGTGGIAGDHAATGAFLTLRLLKNQAKKKICLTRNKKMGIHTHFFILKCSSNSIL